METANESISKAEPYSERDLKLVWEKSSAQIFHIYNVNDHGRKYYKLPTEGYGFARKGLVALLSIHYERSGKAESGYSRQEDSALVDIYKASEGEPLIVRL